MKNKLFVTLFMTFALAFTAMAASFNYQYEDLARVLNDISGTYKIPIIFSNDIGGSVSASFESDSIEDTLKKVLIGTGYIFAKMDGIYLVGDANSSDRIHQALYKPTVVFLNDTDPKTVYDLLGTLSRYVIYAPNTMAMVIDADTETTKKITDMISKIDLPNANRFISYEVHELTEDEYQRFRKFEEYSKSGVLFFSNYTFDVFKEITNINGESDMFGNVAIPVVGEMQIDSTSPAFTINVKSAEPYVNALFKTEGNAAVLEMTTEKPHSVLSTRINGKRFLVLTSFADTPDDSELLNLDEKKPVNILSLEVGGSMNTGMYTGKVSYGSDETQFFVESEFGLTSASTFAVAIGINSNLIDQMYGTAKIGLENGSPYVIGELSDTTEVGFVRMKGSVSEKATLQGFEDPLMSIAVGIWFENLDILGGFTGQWNALEPYVEANIKYEWFSGTVSWQNSKGYVLGIGLTGTW